MPVININGNYRHISWQRLSNYATMAGVTAETFLNRYGKPAEGHQGLPFQITPAALVTATTQPNTTNWETSPFITGNAVSVDTATQMAEDTTATTMFTAAGFGGVS